MDDPVQIMNQQLVQRLTNIQDNLKAKNSDMRVQGRLTRMVGLTMEAVGCEAALGARCLIAGEAGKYHEAEVVGFQGDTLYLMPLHHISHIRVGARVIPQQSSSMVNVGMKLLGRVLDGTGEPLDNRSLNNLEHQFPLSGEHINPLQRAPIDTALDVGVRAINALLTVGRGQRMGLFAGSGVGKSVLLGMMTKYSNADVIVVGLIGERGREVNEFIHNILGKKGMARAVVVAVPADQSPVLRLRGAQLATSIAEYYRSIGLHVLLLMDSLTRYAQAQREIALAIGEPPATKGYPPSVFAKLPSLVERAGNSRSGHGSITAFYTVLTEGDDQQDPIADAARAILDGHVVLSRDLAEMGHYPAIDIESSISRVMNEIVDDSHRQNSLIFKKIYSLFQQNKDLINVGAYSNGADPLIDQSIRMQPMQLSFLQQSFHQGISYSDSIRALELVMQQQPEQAIATQANNGIIDI